MKASQPPPTTSREPVPELLSIAQAGRILGVSRRTVERRIHEGDIRVIHLSRRCVRIDPQELARFLRKSSG